MEPKKVSKVTFFIVVISCALVLGFNHGSESDEQLILDSSRATTQSYRQQSMHTTIQSANSGVNGNAPGVSSDYITDDLEKIIMMPEDEAWNYLTHGLFPTFPADKTYNGNITRLQELGNYVVEMEVPVWVFSTVDDNSTDLTKTSSTLKLRVLDTMEPLFEAVFKTAYDDPEQPVVDLRCTEAYQLRPKTSGANFSSHGLGTTVDLNHAHSINGYGNLYGHQVMSTDMWNSLPNTQKKYYIHYQGGPWERIFKSFGFKWGGDFGRTKDAMHFAFMFEGNNTRAEGQANYQAFKNK